jgi:alpha-mannosidase
MKFEEIQILLPCHSLEDFPMHHEGEEAEGLLAGWTAMWHPALLASARRLPSWSRADSPSEELSGRLLIVPQVSESLLLAGWAARAKSEGACVIRKQTSREEIVRLALAELDGAPELPRQTVDDFFALGLAYLQVELLTRQMRYMSNLDEVHFQAETLRAAEAAVAGDADQTRRHLVSCFEVLTEARERFYPAESYLLDLTLLASTTLGDALRDELASPVAMNLLATAETIEQLAADRPDLLAMVKQAWDEGKLSLAGGEMQEGELPLLPIESILDDVVRAGAIYETHLGRRPRIFGRRRFGLTPLLPQILARSGFTGAIHATFDDGQFPRGDQSKARWEGIDSAAIDALHRIPLDASRPESFLSFPTKMGESMDLDHVATMVFAHWPGQSSVWYRDLRRISSFSPVMGRFVTLEEFFEQTDSAGRLSRHLPDQYRAPYLKQAVIRRQEDAISRLAKAHRQQAAQQSLETVNGLVAMLGGKAESTDRTGEQPVAEPSLAAAGATLAAALPRGATSQGNGYLLCNPLSFTRRMAVEVPAMQSPPAVTGPVKAAEQQGDSTLAVVDVPPLGFCWIGPGGASPPPEPVKTSWLFGRGKSKQNQLLAEGTSLRNEHIEVTIDPQTGGVRSVHDYRTRGNRLSQQLAFRLPTPRPKPGDLWHDSDLDANYSSMAADSVEVTRAGSTLGEIVSRGRLLDPEGKRLAGFRQTYQLWRGSPVLLIQIELEIDEEPRADPWNSYYAARFAWADSAADLVRSVGWATQATEAKRLEAPLFVEARTETTRTAVLSGGLPYHRRIGDRMLDTLLMVRGETQRVFRLGVGFDLSYPLPAALELISPVVVAADSAPPPRPAASGWLFHLDARNVVASHWAPVVDESRVVGFRTRLIETEGRAGRALLRTFKPAASARQTDFLGQTLAELPVDSEGIRLDFTAHEWVQVEARWKE